MQSTPLVGRLPVSESPKLTYEAWNHVADMNNLAIKRVVACICEVIEVAGLSEKQEKAAISSIKNDIYEVLGGVSTNLWDCVPEEERQKVGIESACNRSLYNEVA